MGPKGTLKPTKKATPPVSCSSLASIMKMGRVAVGLKAVKTDSIERAVKAPWKRKAKIAKMFTVSLEKANHSMDKDSIRKINVKRWDAIAEGGNDKEEKHRVVVNEVTKWQDDIKQIGEELIPTANKSNECKESLEIQLGMVHMMLKKLLLHLSNINNNGMGSKEQHLDKNVDIDFNQTVEETQQPY